MVKRIPIIKGGNGIEYNNIFMIIIIFLLSFLIYKICRQEDIKSRYVAPLSKKSKNNDFHDVYSPPLKNDNEYYNNRKNMSLDVRGSIPLRPIPLPVLSVPLSINTQGDVGEYSQLGLLTKDESDKYPLILPLMGRRINRNKFQYYTISNTGNVNTKLPLKKNGRSCTDERGCDELYSGDAIFVEGYKASFKTTIYENSDMFRYIL